MRSNQKTFLFQVLFLIAIYFATAAIHLISLKLDEEGLVANRNVQNRKAMDINHQGMNENVIFTKQFLLK